MSVKGQTWEKGLTTEEILKATSGGYDVYMLYLGKVERVMKCPWRSDRHPSWGIFPANGIWMWKDQATGRSGSAIQFVESMFGLTFGEAKDKIKWDFGLEGGKEVGKRIVNWESPVYEDKEYAIIDYERMPFGKIHHEYWNCAGVSEQHCNDYNCFAAKKVVSNKVYVPFNDKEPVFVYECEEGLKVYFPIRERERKWKNNVPGSFLWNFDNVERCDKLIVQKSYKDLIVSTLFTPNVIATQSEQTSIFNEHIISRINEKAKQVYISFGSDPDGKAKSIEITKATGWLWINPYNELLPATNDFYSMAKHQGIRQVEHLLQSKGII